jgi:HAD superfamily phosphatase (TIGR01668 family)
VKNIEDVIVNKILDLIDFTLSKFIKADMNIKNVREITEEVILKLKNEEQIEGIIIDLDETLRKDMNSIPKCNREWLEMVAKHLKIIILSNGKDDKIEEFFETRGINYIYLAHKPLKKNFLRACEKISVDPKKVVVVGDGIFQDIHGGNKNNMKTIQVHEVEDDER